MKLQNPIIVDKLLEDSDYNNLLSNIPDLQTLEYQEGFSRYIISDGGLKILGDLANKLTPIAQKIFNSETLMPTYTLFSHYEGPNASLYKHKDDNACTYTLDMCVYQKEIWPLWVEGVPYFLKPNQALAYYGNDQEHWREEFPDPNNNNVAMIFFHFAEPDHWWFAKGRDYLRVIRKQISEDEWNANNP
ncbi:hypothetical protein EBU24_05720 [bacterium]|nr:hypothetical protein [bacterium]